MGLWSGTKTVFSKAFDWRIDKWMSLPYAKDVFDQTKSIVFDLVKPKGSGVIETYEEAMERLALTNDDIAQRKKEFHQLFLSFMCIGFAVVVYGAYMLFMGHPWLTLISMLLSLYAFANAFKFHFWLYQIKQKRLGCTFKEWLNSEVYSVEARKNRKAVKKPKGKD